jgi:hypothetical protein
MIDANKKLFSPIYETFKKHAEGEINYSDYYPYNCIDFDKSDIEIFKNLKIIHNDIIISGIRYVYLTIKNEDGIKLFLAITNFDFDSSLISDLQLITIYSENTAPFFLILSAREMNTLSKEFYRNKYVELWNERLYNEPSEGNPNEYVTSGDKKIRKHKLEDIEKYFNKYTIFEIPEDSIFFFEEKDIKDAIREDLLVKPLLYLISLQEDLIKLAYETETKKLFRSFSKLDIITIPYLNILESLVAIKWKYAYKDLYRCIENLYGFPSIKTSFETCGVTPGHISYDKLYVFREKLRETWKYTEESSLIEIIKDYESSGGLINEFTSLFNYQKGDRSGFLGRQLYKLRNSYVHYIPRSRLTQDDFDDEKWDKIIYEFLTLIIKIYKLYK